MDIFNPDSVAEEIAKANRTDAERMTRADNALSPLRKMELLGVWRGRHGHPGLLDRNCDQCIEDGS